MDNLTKSLTVLTLITGALMPLSAAPASPLAMPAPAQSALTILLTAPASPLPMGTKLLAVRVVDGLATVDLSREFVDNFVGGDSAEMRAVNSLLRTMGQFSTVSRVQIEVEGQPIDSLGGLLVLSDPLPVIRPLKQSEALLARHMHRKAVSGHYTAGTHKKA
jgi:hypothetical protein